MLYVEDDNNHIRLERCYFSGNGGTGLQTDFGAAVALSYLVRFQQRVTAIRQEIVNW